MPADLTGQALATCPTGSIALGGSCHLVEDGGGATTSRLLSSGPSATDPNTWVCDWRNGPGFTATIHAEVRCLVPPT
jgi:hypothetical protein